MITQEMVVGMAMFLALIVVCFMVFRAVVLWYFRVNEAMANLKIIAQELKDLNANARSGRL